MKLLLVFIISLVQAAGPLLCCCGPARLLSQPVTTQPISSDAVPAINCAVCCQKQQADAPGSKQPTPAKKSCPLCPENRQCDGIALAPATVVRISDAEQLGTTGVWDVAPTVGLLEFFSASTCTDAVWDEHSTSDLPFLTTEMRLYTHHALRC